MSRRDKKVKKSPKYIEVERMFYDYEYTKKEIEYIDEEIEFLKHDRNGCGTIQYNEKVQTSANIESSTEKELEANKNKIGILEEEKYKKVKDIKRIERAIENFNEEEEVMFKIRYILKIKDWSIYAEKMNVGKEKYYEIKDKMIAKSIRVMFPYYNVK
jgi:hypothetical protein|nr:MAG TPA: Protein of unknown function (DUF722) [Bacteriophage sp.]